MSDDDDDDDKECKGEYDGDHEYTRAIRKAKLLARITQLAKRGIRPNRTPTWRSSELDLEIEVAYMEHRLAQLQAGARAFGQLGAMILAEQDKDIV